MHAVGKFVLLNVWDAASAALLAKAGTRGKPGCDLAIS
jgi:2-methylisocitrate lyase-like PEP mutase family enzyme